MIYISTEKFTIPLQITDWINTELTFIQYSEEPLLPNTCHAKTKENQTESEPQALW